MKNHLDQFDWFSVWIRSQALTRCKVGCYVRSSLLSGCSRKRRWQRRDSLNRRDQWAVGRQRASLPQNTLSCYRRFGLLRRFVNSRGFNRQGILGDPGADIWDGRDEDRDFVPSRRSAAGSPRMVFSLCFDVFTKWLIFEIFIA